MKIKQYSQIVFLVVGSLTVMEFLLVRGMFTWLIAVGAALIAGVLNIAVNVIYKDWLQALMFLLATVALCMGYFVML